MFGDQTSPSIVWWPKLMLKWVAKQLKHVWSNTDQTIDTRRWASVVRMPASNLFDTRLSKGTKHQTLEQNYEKCFKFLMECRWPSNFIKHDQTRSNNYMIKRHQTRWPNGKMFVTKQRFIVFGRQTFPVCPGLKERERRGLMFRISVWNCALSLHI